MFDVLLSQTYQHKAEIAICGCYYEYLGKTETFSVMQNSFELYENRNLINALVSGTINNGIWNKIYRSTIFSGVVFPKGHVFEDVSTVFKLFLNATMAVKITKPLYHYRTKRAGSITDTHTLTNLIDYWLAHKSRYDFF